MTSFFALPSSWPAVYIFGMDIIVDESAINRIQELRTVQDKDALFLRIRVEGGGCSGFQYKMELSDSRGDRDLIFKDTVVTDEISLNLLKGSTVSFEQGLIGSEFKISNPNAVSGCGCGTSFSII